MITRQELEGKWKQVKGQIRERWGQLTDDELQRAQGNAEELVGVIQQKTGQSRREIEEFLEKALHEGQSAVQKTMETARQYAETAGKNLQESYEGIEQQLEAGYDEARRMVRARPFESVVASFGAGVIAGVVVSLLLRPQRH